MWHAALCSGLVALSCAGRNFEEILQHLTRSTMQKASCANQSLATIVETVSINSRVAEKGLETSINA